MPLKCSRFAAVVGMVTLSASSAFAGVDSWPSVRHDARRTGLSEGVGKLTIPAVRGRSFLGGSLSTPRLLVEDVNSDGTNEVLLANGGRVLAKDAQNRVLWDTALLEVQSLHGVYDFNGDGVEEVLALGRDGLHILNLRNGSLLWHKTDYSTSNNITSATNTSVVDLTGDGLPEIIVKPFWFSDGFVYVYSFSEGFDLEEPNSNQLWAYELRQDFIGGFYPTVGDVDLDGVPEIVSSTDDHLVVIDGLTGAEDASFELEHTLYFGRTEIRNIDQDPQPEIIHITNQYGHSLEVFDLLKSREEPMSEVAWASTDSLTIPRNALQDLDGDGTFEFFLNQFDGSQWHTLIYQYESKIGRAHV